MARDFVELPSQLYEHWFMTREVMREYCRHAETGEPIPEAIHPMMVFHMKLPRPCAPLSLLRKPKK